MIEIVPRVLPAREFSSAEALDDNSLARMEIACRNNRRQ